MDGKAVTTTVKFGNLYLGNKMTGIPYFNVPWFNETAALLRIVRGVDQVFNPAEWDVLRGFDPMACPNGTTEEATAAGFNLRAALGADWKWIADNSNGLIVGPDWHTSKGTISEIACHQALGLPVWEWAIFRKIFEPQTVIRPQNPDELFDTQWQFPPLANYLI
jgi:hypothetical protein